MCVHLPHLYVFDFFKNFISVCIVFFQVLVVLVVLQQYGVVTDPVHTA